MDQKSMESEDMFQYVTMKIEEDRVVKHVTLTTAGLETISGIAQTYEDFHRKCCTVTTENQLQTTQLLSDALAFEFH